LASAAQGGAGALDKDAFARRLASLGSSINASAGNDFSELRLKCLHKHWDETFALMVDGFLRPALPKSGVELQRQRQLAFLHHELEDPDPHLRLLATEMVFWGHPYRHRAMGTLETVARLTLEQLGRHLAKLRERTRLLLVVVGDVDPDHVVAQARSAFADVP